MSPSPVILITGANRGIGRSISRAFAKRHYRVGINYRQDQKEAETTSKLVIQDGGTPWLLPGDVTDISDVQQIFEAVSDQWGRIDILVNNAGIVRNQFLSKMTYEEWTKVLDVNLTGPFLCAQAAIPMMRRQKGGMIWNVSSFLAKRPGRGVANYASAKAGLIAMTKALALEEGRFHIRANVLIPGFHLTDMNKDIWPKIQEDVMKQHLLGVLPKTEDVGEFLYQLSQFSNLTGQEFAFEGRLL